MAPDWRMTSGTRKPPPISTSSPREMITSRPSASAARSRSVAAALLLTTTAASAPVTRAISVSACTSRRPREPAEVVFEIRVAAGDLLHARERAFRQRRTAQIGMDDDAGGIDDANERRTHRGAEPRLD